MWVIRVDWNTVLPAPLAFLHSLCVIRASPLTQNETSCKVLWDLGFSLTSETFVFRILFQVFFSLDFFFRRLDSYCDFLTNLHFFCRHRNFSLTCEFLFLDLYFFQNWFFLRTSIVWKKYVFEKIQVRK